MADPAKRRSATIKSAAFELVLVIVRVALIAVLGLVLLSVDNSVAALVSALMVCAWFWARETLLTLARVHGAGQWLRYPALLSNVGGLALIVVFAEGGGDPIRAATAALVLREAIKFAGYAVVALFGRARGQVDVGDGAYDADEDEEDGAGKARPLIGPDGREIRSTFRILIADNVVYSGWRIVQFGTRTLANGLLGPIGGIGSRIFFTYRKPGAFVERKGRPQLGRLIAMAIALIGVAVLVAFLAQRSGLLHAAGILAAAFVLRIVALGLNLLVWRHFRPLIGTPGRIRLLDLLLPRRRQRKADKPTR